MRVYLRASMVVPSLVRCCFQLHPVLAPHVVQVTQVPVRTNVALPHSEQSSAELQLETTAIEAQFSSLLIMTICGTCGVDAAFSFSASLATSSIASAGGT